MRRRHCLFALARNAGYQIPPIPDVSRHLVPALAFVLLTVRDIMTTLVRAVVVPRQPRPPIARPKPPTPRPIASAVIRCDPEPMPSADPETLCAEYDAWSATLPTTPTIAKPKLVPMERTGLPLAPIWHPIALPLVPAFTQENAVEVEEAVGPYFDDADLEEQEPAQPIPPVCMGRPFHLLTPMAAELKRREPTRERVAACEVRPTAAVRAKVRNVVKDEDAIDAKGYRSMSVKELRRLVPGSRLMRREALLQILEGKA